MLLLLVSVIAGFALARAIWPAPRQWSACDPVRLAVAPVLGTGLASVAYYLVRLVGGGPPVSAIGTLLLFSAAAVGAAYLRAPAAEADPLPQGSKAPIWMTALAGVAAALAAISFLLMVAAAPHGEWDAWSIWNLRARFLFRAVEFVSPFSPLIEWTHPDYPLFLPASITLFWHGAGEESMRVVALLQAGLACSALAAPFTVIRHVRGGALAAVTALAIAGGSTLVRNAATLYADVPLAACMAAGMAAWTKNEGQLFLIILLAAAAVAWRHIPYLLAGAAPMLAVLGIFKLKSTAANDLVNSANAANYGSRLADLNRYWITFWGFISESLTFSHFLIPPVLVFAVWLALVRLRQPVPRTRWIPLAVAGAQLAGYFLVFVATAADLDWQINGSMARLLLHVWPIALFGVFLVSADLTPE